MLEESYAKMAKENKPEYFDICNRPATLTDAEQAYFQETVALVKNALGVEIPVYMFNQEILPGSAADALGVHWMNENSKDEFITIDNYFIHECYEAAFHGAYLFEDENLVSVLCHEIAHMRYQRHTKYHANLTQKYINQVAAQA